jgi:DNA polymerase-1
MKLENVEKPYYEIMMPLARTSVNMRLRGTPVDEEKLEKAHSEVVGTYDQLQETMENQGWNPRSTHQMRQLLLAMGLKVGKSLDKENLEKLWLAYPEHPVLAAIIRHRKLDTDRKVYESMMRRLRNGRIHTDWDPSGTRTGRIASRDPNLMNLTEHHRDIFIADPGMQLMSADYSRLEIMVAAARSNDPDMIDDAWNKDIHAQYRKWVYGKEEMPYYETRVAKMIVFGAMYGRSARSIAQQFKVSVAEAQRMIDHLMNRYPIFNRQLEEDKRVAATEGKIRTPFGRVRHFYEGNIKSMAVNTPIQSGAADITLKSLNRLESELQSGEGDVLMSVHDQIIIQFPDGEERRYFEMMKDIMETPVPELGNRRFPIEVKIGPNWKDLSVYARN